MSLCAKNLLILAPNVRNQTLAFVLIQVATLLCHSTFCDFIKLQCFAVGVIIKKINQ